MGEAPGFFRAIERLFAEAVRAWLQRHGVHTGPTFYTDSLRMSVDGLSLLKARGGGPDPLADAYPLGRDVVEAIEWRGREQAPDLIGKLREELRP